jgi:hypothetical protein
MQLVFSVETTTAVASSQARRSAAACHGFVGMDCDAILQMTIDRVQETHAN